MLACRAVENSTRGSRATSIAWHQVHFETSLPAFITSAPAAQALLDGVRTPMQLAADTSTRVGLMSIWQRQGFAVCLFLFLYTLMAVSFAHHTASGVVHVPARASDQSYATRATVRVGDASALQLFAWRVRRLKYRTKNDLEAFRDYKQKLAVIMKKGAGTCACGYDTLRQCCGVEARRRTCVCNAATDVMGRCSFTWLLCTHAAIRTQYLQETQRPEGTDYN